MATRYDSITLEKPVAGLAGGFGPDMNASDGYLIERDGDTVTVRHPTSPQVLEFHWSRVVLRRDVTEADTKVLAAAKAAKEKRA